MSFFVDKNTSIRRKTLMLEQTKTILAQLKLHGMLSSLDLRIHEATSHGWGHGELLAALASDERTHRNNKQTQRRIRAAHFRTDACEERIDLTAKRNLTKTQVRDLMELEFIKVGRNVLIQGPTGVGKTYLATAIGNQACRRGYTCTFIGMNELIERVEVARAEGTFLKYRERLIKVDCLILDDLGIKPLPPSMVQDLYDVLEERYQDRCTVITSQLPIENWKEVIEDTVALEAILDRLIHGAVRLQLQGESMRKKKAQGSLDKASGASGNSSNM
jgi:DNA replication protein DnaC